jgi:hypothetical protein
MTVIRPNSILGITSITAQGDTSVFSNLMEIPQDFN